MPTRDPDFTDSAGERPYVLLNMAMTADGKVATANRAVTSFGSARDQRHLLELRATADAVLCGAATVNEAGITLGVGGARYERLRRKRGLAAANLRIVVSGRARLRTSADLFREPGGPILVLVSRAAAVSRIAALRRRTQTVVHFGRDTVDLGAALRWLRREWGVRRLVCEGGPELNDAMFRAGLVDEVHVTICPKVFGGRRAPTLAEGLGWTRLAQARRLQLQGVRAIQGELYLVYRAEGHPRVVGEGSGRGRSPSAARRFNRSLRPRDGARSASGRTTSRSNHRASAEASRLDESR